MYGWLDHVKNEVELGGVLCEAEREFEMSKRDFGRQIRWVLSRWASGRGTGRKWGLVGLAAVGTGRIMGHGHGDRLLS